MPITQAELDVFHLSEQIIPHLQVAYTAYEHLIGVEQFYDNLLYDLIVKARSICPPAQYAYGKQIFTLYENNIQWFQWFAKTFMDISNREAHGFWQKIRFNLDYLMVYPDEEFIQKAS